MRSRRSRSKRFGISSAATDGINGFTRRVNAAYTGPAETGPVSLLEERFHRHVWSKTSGGGRIFASDCLHIEVPRRCGHRQTDDNTLWNSFIFSSLTVCQINSQMPAVFVVGYGLDKFRINRSFHVAPRNFESEIPIHQRHSCSQCAIIMLHRGGVKRHIL